jgi:hypothetical protein
MIPGAVDAKVTNPADWSGIYRIALSVADRALQDCRPTSMAVEYSKGVEVAPEGMAGFAWVHFPDARTKFVRWLLKEGYAEKVQPGAHIRAPSCFIEVISPSIT